MAGTSMQPDRDSDFITIPISFDSHGGRSSQTKTKVLAVLIMTLVLAVLSVFIWMSQLELWRQLLYELIVVFVYQYLVRMFVFKEAHYSDQYESLKASDFDLSYNDFWGIFEIEEQYPYICYFRNGWRGIFVRMERGPVTGKDQYAMYDHYEKISDSYNVAHSRDMNIVHIDYMDTVGNDERLNVLYDRASQVANPDMQEMLYDIYDNLKEEMSRNYASYDIYLFLSKDRSDNFLYSVQTVAGNMLGGNFITYNILDKLEVASIAKALFNFNDFSLDSALETAIGDAQHTGLTAISLEHEDGTVEKLNKTTQERRQELEERQREAAMRKQNKSRGKKKDNESQVNKDEEVDIF